MTQKPRALLTSALSFLASVVGGGGTAVCGQPQHDAVSGFEVLLGVRPPVSPNKASASRQLQMHWLAVHVLLLCRDSVGTAFLPLSTLMACERSQC